MEDYKLWLQDKGKMDNTINLYIQKVKLFIKWYQESYDREFDNKILPLHIRNYKSYLMTVRKINAKTINNYLASIKSYCDFLIEKGILETNPFNKEYFIDIQKTFTSPVKMDNKDFNKLEESIVHYGSKRDIAIFYTLAYTGIRVSELCNIRLNDIIKDELIIYYGKGGKQRSIPLNTTVKEAINEWLKERYKYKYADTVDYLFIGERGKMNRATIFKMIREYCYIARIEPISPHQLRHYFCKRALEKGFNIVEVSALAGHSNIETTRIYIKPAMKELKNKMNML
ncbi:tyrosine-type recombinase/integrase [Caldicellulosiruptoraceae bacterium PP1]